MSAAVESDENRAFTLKNRDPDVLLLLLTSQLTGRVKMVKALKNIDLFIC